MISGSFPAQFPITPVETRPTTSRILEWARMGRIEPTDSLTKASNVLPGRSALGQHRLYGLKERYVVADADRVLMGHGQGEGLG